MRFRCWLTHQTPELKKVFWIMRGPITATIVVSNVLPDILTHCNVT